MVRARKRDDRGVTVVIFGISAMMLIVVAAVVIDLGASRADRRADQKMADAAATAGAIMVPETYGRGACEAALDYLEANIDGVSSFAGADCSSFPNHICTAADSSASTVGTADGYRIEIVYPVPKTHPFMQRASAIGSDSVTTTSRDGEACERIGVSIELERASFFGQAVGQAERTTEVHAVALTYGLIPPDLPINLLILERERCDAIVIDGNPRLVVGSMTSPAGDTLPGVLAVDSDGSGANCGPNSNGTLHAQGQTAYIRADGVPGCPAELQTDPQTGVNVAGLGQGCGYLELFAPGVPGPPTPLYCEGGVYRPACTSTAVVRPHPNRMAERRTRAPVDYRYNCKKNYGPDVVSGNPGSPWYGNQPIPGCDHVDVLGVEYNYSDDTDWVDELQKFADNGASIPAGFNIYGDDPATEPCVIDGQTTKTVPQGNTYVSCPLLEVKRLMTFEGGNVIFAGDVSVTSQGDLRIHACGNDAVNNCSAPPATNPLPWTPGSNYDERQYSNDAAWVYFRSGAGITKAGQGSVRIYDSTVFFSRTSDTGASRAMQMQGGDGVLQWYAPREGPFASLAMWSEATAQHDLAGQSALDLEGIYFAPVAHVTYAGTSGQKQVAAQLVVKTLRVSGGGSLEVSPSFLRSIHYPTPRETTLIR